MFNLSLASIVVILVIVFIAVFLFNKSRKQKIAAKTAMQRHHDYYVKLKREGRLPLSDCYSYALARMREEAGEVDPLPEDDESTQGWPTGYVGDLDLD